MNNREKRNENKKERKKENKVLSSDLPG